MDRLHENQIYTGTVEGYSSEGLGIVRLDGAVVFVPQAVRGETIDLKITKVMKTAAGGGRLALPCRSQGRKRPALGETSSPGKYRDTPCADFRCRWLSRTGA